MPNKEIFVLKIIWKKSIASLHRLTQAVQRANLRRTAGDPTWVFLCKRWILSDTHCFVLKWVLRGHFYRSKQIMYEAFPYVVNLLFYHLV